MSKFITVSKAAEYIGVTPKTMREWDNSGILKAHKTAKGHRRYLVSELDIFLNNSPQSVETEKKEFRVHIYARVSTKKQFDSENLARQSERLENYCKENGYIVDTMYTEVASGINENRPQLKKMLSNLNNIDKIVVEYPDRLARFGLEYIKIIANQNNVQIEFVEENENKSANEEMAEDIVSIITCFSARLYGARGGRKIKKALDELNAEC